MARQFALRTIISGFGSEIRPKVNWTTSSTFSLLLLTFSILYLQLNIFPESHSFFMFIFILNHKRLYFIDFCHAGMTNKFYCLGFLALGSVVGQTILSCKTEPSVCSVLHRQMVKDPSRFIFLMYLHYSSQENILRALREDLIVNTKPKAFRNSFRNYTISCTGLRNLFSSFLLKSTHF